MAEPALVADEDLGGHVRVRARVEPSRQECLSNDPVVSPRIDERLELPLDLGAEPLELGPRLHDALCLPSFAVDEDAGETEGKRPCLFPVDVRKPVAGGLLTLLEYQVSLLLQPG